MSTALVESGSNKAKGDAHPGKRLVGRVSVGARRHEAENVVAVVVVVVRV